MLQIAQTSAAISEHCDKLQGESDAFLAQQRQHKAAAVKCSDELKAALQQQLAEFQAALASHAEQSSQQLQENAAALQAQLQSLLQNLVTQGSAAFAASAAQTTEFCAAAGQQLQSHTDSTQRGITELFACSEQHAQQLRESSAQTSRQHAALMDSVEAHRASASSCNAEISGSVGAKRKFLDDTVSGLVTAAADAIAEAVDVVDSTATAAGTVLTDVSNASNAMHSAASASMSEFTAFMDREGEQLRSGLQQHFEVLQQHNAEQHTALGALQAAGSAHDFAISSSALQPVGGTPQKVPLCGSLESPLKKSRLAAEVKEQQRQQIGAVPYPAASDALEREFLAADDAAADVAADGADCDDADAAPVAASAGAEQEAEQQQRLSKGSLHSMSSLSVQSAQSVDSADADAASVASAAGENANPNEAPSCASAASSPKLQKSPLKPARQTRGSKRAAPARGASKTRGVAMDGL